MSNPYKAVFVLYFVLYDGFKPVFIECISEPVIEFSDYWNRENPHC